MGGANRDTSSSSYFSLLLVMFGTIAGGLANRPPETPWGWGLLILGGLAVGAGTVQGGRLLRPWIAAAGRSPKLPKLARKITLRQLGWSAVAVVVLVVAFVVPGWAGSVEVTLFGCRPPAEVRVLTTPELVEPYQRVAEDYERSTAAENNGCRAAHLFVFGTRPDAALDGLVTGWQDEYLRDHGPRPDVWLPDSPSLVAEARARAGTAAWSVRAEVPVGYSPIVLAVPAPVAGLPGLRDLPRYGRTWAEIFRAGTVSGSRMTRPDPEQSTVGEYATAALYDSQVPGTGSWDRAAWRREVEQWIDPLPGSHDAPAPATSPAGDGPVSIMSEQSVIRHNQGVRRDTGRTCAGGQAPERCLLAYYPADTPWSHLHLVRLRWVQDPAGQRQQDAAADFQTWLSETDDGSNSLHRSGLRPERPAVEADGPEPVTETNGVLPSAPLLHPPVTPDAGERRAVVEQYKIAKRPGRVLLAIDASGSMNTKARNGTRFDVAKLAVRRSLGNAGARDEVGLSFFTARTPADRAPPARPLGPSGAHTAEVLDQVRPAGNTPLHRAVVDGVTALGPGGADRVSALVVLVDGTDNVGGLSSMDMVGAVRGKGVAVFVVAFGEAHCSAEALTAVTAATGGDCRQADEDSLDDVLTALTRQLWTGVAHGG